MDFWQTSGTIVAKAAQKALPEEQREAQKVDPPVLLEDMMDKRIDNKLKERDGQTLEQEDVDFDGDGAAPSEAKTFCDALTSKPAAKAKAKAKGRAQKPPQCGGKGENQKNWVRHPRGWGTIHQPKAHGIPGAA